MAIYLVQHGKSFSAEIDKDRNLTEEWKVNYGYIDFLMYQKQILLMVDQV